MNTAESYKQQMNKFSAGILLIVFVVFICINELGSASVLFLFDAKKKEPSAAASRGETVVYDKRNGFYVSNINFIK